MTTPKDLQKARAVALRASGRTLREISEAIDVPRSTLSDWLTDLSEDVEALRIEQQQRAQAVLYEAGVEAAETLVSGLKAGTIERNPDGEYVLAPDFKERRMTSVAVLDRLGVSAKDEPSQHLHQHLHQHADWTDDEAEYIEGMLRQKPEDVIDAPITREEREDDG